MDKDKIPDLIDFYITKHISSSYLELDNVDDFISDPVLMTINTNVIRKKKRQILTNKFTDWDKFREKLDKLIDLRVRLKNTNELDIQAQDLVDAVHSAAKTSTPSKNTWVQDCYPFEIREIIVKRRKARCIWQRFRNPIDKNMFNIINNQLNRLIKDINNKNFKDYLSNLTADDDTNYSLWKATSKR